MRCRLSLVLIACLPPPSIYNSQNGWTAMHMAALNGDTEIVRILDQANSALAEVEDNVRRPQHSLRRPEYIFL